MCATRRRLGSAGAKSGRGDVKRTTRCELAIESPKGGARTVFSIGLNAVYAPGQSRATRETGAKKRERYGRPEGEPTPCFASALRRIGTLGKRKRELIVNVLCSGAFDGVKHVDFPFGPTCANLGFGA